MIKRTGLVLVILLNLICMLNAQTASNAQTHWPLKIYNDTYIITGIGDDQVKLNFSLMYDIFYSYKIGFYLGYTQTMFWALYNISSPFSEIDFNPDFFWRFQSKNNFLNDLDLIFVDYIQLGLYEHSSNGKDSDTSRAFNRSYIQAQLSVGSFINIGINAKYCIYYYPDSCNPDISDYLGPLEGKIFININNESKPDRWQVYARFGIGRDAAGNWTLNDGWQEYGFLTSVLFSYVRLYAQVYYGYGESLIKYNVRADNSLTGLPLSIRAGIALDLPD